VGGHFWFGKVPPRSRFISLTKVNKMNYFEEIDAWLTSVLEGLLEEPSENALQEVKSDIKDKILESYRNGQKAGPKPPKEVRGAEAAERPKSRYGYPKRGSDSYYRKPSRQ